MQRDARIGVAEAERDAGIRVRALLAEIVPARSCSITASVISNVLLRLPCPGSRVQERNDGREVLSRHQNGRLQEGAGAAKSGI